MKPYDRETRRVLDANLNRAAEALRVVEEYCRFLLDHGPLAAELKGLRHDLAGLARAAQLTAAQRVAARDVDNDVGKPDGSAPPPGYPGAGDLLAANLSRLSEALRVLAEYSRLGGPPEAAARAEALRFRAYALANGVEDARPRVRLQAAHLYFLLSGELSPARPAELARAVARGGAAVVQLRGFHLGDRALLALARDVGDAVRAEGSLFVVNDRLDVALAAEADGVHLGRDDLPVSAARRAAPGRFLVGASVRSAGEALEAFTAGADYVGLGAAFPSPLKPDRPVLGLDAAAAVAKGTSQPVFPIGGVDLEGVQALAGRGVNRACVSSALMEAEDPEGLARTMRSILAGES